MRNERGFALIITLIVTALLVAVAVEFIHHSYVEASLAGSYRDAQQASLMADSGVKAKIKQVQYYLALQLATQQYTSFLDPWAAPLELEDERGKLLVEIIDENAKLNLNSIVYSAGAEHDKFYPMAQRLMQKLKLSTDLCDSVADWTDTGDEPRSGGAEASYYRSLPTPYGAKNAYLDTFDELRMVKGFDEKTLKAMSPFFTVYNEGSSIIAWTINLNTASREVLAVLDENMNDDLAGRVLEYRKTRPIKSVAEISGIPGLETVAPNLQGIADVKGTVFRIFSRATVNETTRIVEALVKIDALNSSILYWREL